MAKRAPVVQEGPVEQPSMTTFSDVTFQLLIFFMLTIQFKQEEGNLVSLLPKDKGPANTVVDPNLEEIRIGICADSIQRRLDRHLGVKEEHQQDVARLKAADPTLGDVCRVWLDQHYREGGVELFRTERYPAKASQNRRTMDELAAQVTELHRRLPKVRIIIDADGLVPWEMPFGMLNALRKRGINDVEWAGNPRLDRYY